jgi:hypothetical protein
VKRLEEMSDAEIAAMTRAEFEEHIARHHIEQYPQGCNQGFGNDCMACAKRLGYAPVHCPVCKAGPFYPKDGRVPAHNAPARGRQGYSRRHMAQFAPACSGTGKQSR